MHVLILTFLLVCLTLAASSPIDHNRKLVNRPTHDVIFRNIRAAPFKGQSPTGTYNVKGVNRPLLPRKGEYICGENNDRICRLRPGEIPKGCENQPCQYPILL